MVGAFNSRAPSRHGYSVVAFLTARKAARSGALWGYVFGIFVASSALGYAVTYKSQAQRDFLAKTFGANAGIEGLIGRAHDIQTVAGFTAWRSLGVLGIVGAVWGILTATRLLRGEEEAGRSEVLLAGRTTRARATAHSLAGLGVGLVVLFGITAAITIVVGLDHRVRIGAGSAAFLAMCLVASGLMFLAVGAFTSQLAVTRRRAAAYGSLVLGVSFVLRLLADSTQTLGWLRWTTPLGWVENLRPEAGPRPLVLLLVGALTLGAAVGAVALAARRDLGSSVIPDHPEAAARTGLLRGPSGLWLRLARATLLEWLVAVGGLALLIGLIAKAAGGAVTGSTSARQALARLGASGSGAKVFLGVTFLIAALLLALAAAGQVTAARAAESSGQLDHFLVRAVPRWRWFSGPVAITAIAIGAGGLAAGLSGWAGSLAQQSGIGLVSMIQAGLNLVFPALFVLGVGAFMVGLWPRATVVLTYGVIVWSFLVEFVGGIAGLNHWLLDTSLFHQMTAAPAVPPDWAVNAIMAAIGVSAASLGLVAFSRRDLVGE